MAQASSGPSTPIPNSQFNQRLACKKLFFRAVSIAFLTLLLMRPLHLIHGVVAERQRLQREVDPSILAGNARQVAFYTYS